MKPEKPMHHHQPRAKPFPDIEMPAYAVAKPLDMRKMYGDRLQQLRAERDAVKSFLPVIELPKETA